MLHLPLITSPLGWVVLGIGGYALYRAGKKKGEDQAAASRTDAAPESKTANKDKKGEK